MKRALSHRTTRVATAVLAAALLVGCGRAFTPATPAGFVDFSDKYSEGEYRAATADGVVLGIRSFDNDPKGPLSFWSRAIELQLRKNGGYALLDQHPVETRTGVKGTLFRFGHDEGSVPHLYELTVYVTEKKIYVLEAGGSKAEVAKLAPAIDGWVKGFVANK